MHPFRRAPRPDPFERRRQLGSAQHLLVVGLAASSVAGLGIFPEALSLVVAVPDLAVVAQLHLQMLLVRLAGQERKVLLVAVRFAHAAVAVEVRDYRTLLARFSLGSWVEDALDELLLLGELVLCGKHIPLPLLQALRVHGLARIPL